MGFLTTALRGMPQRHLALACLILGVSTPAHADHPSPLLDCNGLPCAMVQLTGKPDIKLLIDTGNESSMLDKATADSLGLALAPAHNSKGEVVPGFFKATLHGLMPSRYRFG
ncbi:MAG: hypothetical protein JO142_15960 [Burkholderiales bacterium]|nr:hypothetical protein [Burkholderiales bacterium]